MYNILRAYANFDKEVGYTQGMNYVVAGIIYNLYPDKNVFENIFGTKTCIHFNLSLLESYGTENPNYEEMGFWTIMHIDQ